MAQFRPLHWREGMFVRSHHFQQWDLHLADRLKQLIDQVEPDGWGVGHLAVSDTALQEQRFEIDQALLVFRDGAVVCYPGNAGKASPASRGFENRLQGAGARLGVHLGIRRLQREAPNVAEPGEQGAAPARYSIYRDPEGINDLSTGSNAQPIEFLEYDLRVLFDGDDLQGFDTIKVAEIRRGTQQARPYELSEDYAPPCLRVGASRVLKRMTHDVLQNVHRTLASIQRDKPKSLGAEAGSTRTLWESLRSQTLHASYPVLAANLEDGRCHPRRAFEMIASLAGALGAGWEDCDPLKQPKYDHEQPARSFKPLRDLVVDLLGRLYPAEYQMIELEREGEYFGASLAPVFFERGARLYIMVRTARVPEHVISTLRPVMKIGSRNRVHEELVRKRQAGVPFEPCPAPGEYPSEPGQIFFKITPSGEEWRAVESEATLSAYMPIGDPAGAASLILVRPEGAK
jgi:type VI secretion system protein ImpJ